MYVFTSPVLSCLCPQEVGIYFSQSKYLLPGRKIDTWQTKLMRTFMMYLNNIKYNWHKEFLQCITRDWERRKKYKNIWKKCTHIHRSIEQNLQEWKSITWTLEHFTVNARKMTFCARTFYSSVSSFSMGATLTSTRLREKNCRTKLLQKRN